MVRVLQLKLTLSLTDLRIARIYRIPTCLVESYLSTIFNFLSHVTKLKITIITNNLVPRVSHLTAPWSARGTGGGKIRDAGNEVGLQGQSSNIGFTG